MVLKTELNLIEPRNSHHPDSTSLSAFVYNAHTFRPRIGKALSGLIPSKSLLIIGEKIIESLD